MTKTALCTPLFLCLSLLASPVWGQSDEADSGSVAEERQDGEVEYDPMVDVELDLGLGLGDEDPALDIDVNLPPLPIPRRDPDHKPPKPSDTDERWNDFVPLFRRQALERGAELPLPMGLGASFMFMDQPLDVTDLKLGLAGSKPTSVGVLNQGGVDATSRTATLRLDTWVLPILNVYGIVGYTWADSDVVLRARVDRPLLPSVTVDIPVEAEFDGPTWGLGGTVAGGYKRFFGMLDVNYTWTDIEEFDHKIEKLVASARIGLQGEIGPFGGAVWIGTMYLNNEQTVEITIPAGIANPVLDGARVEIDQDSDHRMNFLFGAVWQFTKSYQLVIEGGLGDRKQVMVSPVVRF